LSRPKASWAVGYFPDGDVALQLTHDGEQVANVRIDRDFLVEAVAEWMARGPEDLEWIDLTAADGEQLRLNRPAPIVFALQAALDRREPAIALSEDGQPA
jgi:hypothetical protein